MQSSIFIFLSLSQASPPSQDQEQDPQEHSPPSLELPPTDFQSISVTLPRTEAFKLPPQRLQIPARALGATAVRMDPSLEAHILTPAELRDPTTIEEWVASNYSFLHYCPVQMSDELDSADEFCDVPLNPPQPALQVSPTHLFSHAITDSPTHSEAPIEETTDTASAQDEQLQSAASCANDEWGMGEGPTLPVKSIIKRPRAPHYGSQPMSQASTGTIQKKRVSFAPEPTAIEIHFAKALMTREKILAEERPAFSVVPLRSAALLPGTRTGRHLGRKPPLNLFLSKDLQSVLHQWAIALRTQEKWTEEHFVHPFDELCMQFQLEEDDNLRLRIELDIERLVHRYNEMVSSTNETLLFLYDHEDIPPNHRKNPYFLNPVIDLFDLQYELDQLRPYGQITESTSPLDRENHWVPDSLPHDPEAQ
ncbi:MAG: hypothetical protein ACO3A2_10445 [Bdellovibrionia bacterium]